MRTNFVGRSVVSAITQTPASGPLGPVTTPPMSSASMRTAAAVFWALMLPAEAARNAPKATATMPRYRTRFVLMWTLLSLTRGVYHPLVHDTTADHGQHRLDRADLLNWNGEVILRENRQIRPLPDLERSALI